MAAPKFFDRVKETTATVGTAPFVLDGAAIGFRAFGDVLSNGDECYYACNPPGAAEWEVGIGTYNSGVLTRTSVLVSSNNNALVVFPAGTKDIFLDLPADMFAGLIYFGPTPPSNYVKYPLWWNTYDGALKVRYDDGDSVQYVDATPGIVGPQGPQGIQGIQGLKGDTGVMGPTSPSFTEFA